MLRARELYEKEGTLKIELASRFSNPYPDDPAFSTFNQLQRATKHLSQMPS